MAIKQFSLVTQARKITELPHNNEQYQQMELFSNIPMSKGVMNRALTEAENYLIAEIRYCIQERLENDPTIDITRPMTFSISLKDIAKDRGVKNQTRFKEIISNVIVAMRQNIPSISVEYTDSNNEHHVGVMAFFDSIDINKDSGEIHIVSGISYQKYYAQYIMNLPELKINKLYYLNMRSKYSMPLSDYIIGIIGDERKKGHIDNSYEFIVPIDTLYDRVKPSTELVVNDYFKRVLEPAIRDINNNIHAPFSFIFENQDKININELKVKQGRSVIAARFNIQLMITIDHPVFMSYPRKNLVDIAGNPTWEYIETWLRIGLRVNDSYVKKAQSMNISRVWKALVYTLIHAHSPRYFNKICETMNMADVNIKSLCEELKKVHPEYVDDVIESIINMEIQQNTAAEKR